MTNTVEPVRTGTNPIVLRVGAVVGAGVVALGAWAIMTGPMGLDLQALMGSEVADVGPVSALVSAMIAGLGAWAVAAIIDRRSAAPRRRWLQIASTVAVVSLGGPLTSAEGVEAIGGLMVLHLVTAMVVIPLVWWSLPGQAHTGHARRTV